MQERVNNMDITRFITWFVNQVISIFTKSFNILDSIKFSGTSLLNVIITIVILVPLVGVVFTISQNVSVIGQKSERIREKKERAQKNGKSRWI